VSDVRSEADRDGTPRPAMAALPAFIVAGRISIERQPACTRVLVRCSDAIRLKAAARLEQDLGLELPGRPCRAAVHGGLAALWLGPDEWLVRGPLERDADINAALTTAFSGTAHTLVDIGNRHIDISVSGPACADVLNTGCPLDLAHTSFPVGMCTRTLMGKAEIVLWRSRSDLFHVDVPCSFTAYVHATLIEAARSVIAVSSDTERI
jgi:sarcosine oxidase, subunit gamma